MLKWILIILGIPLGIALVILGGIAALSASSLQSQGKVVEATVTQSRTGDQNAYEIQYEFRVDNDPTVYSDSDGTGRRNLWVAVSQKPAADTVEVRYLPSNPWENRPVNATSNPMESASVGLGAGVLFVCVGLLLLVSEIRSRLRKRSPQASASQ